jgi:hypothetical protein
VGAMGLGEYATGEVYEKEGSNAKKKSKYVKIFGQDVYVGSKFWKRISFISRIGFVGSLVAMIIFQNLIPVLVFVFFAIGCVLGLMFA